MSTTFAAQLRQIAATSTNELDLRARRDAHAESLLFERSVAIKQDWETVYQICIEGYRDLCTLDSRLREFEHNLFSQQSKDQDREQMNKAQNEELDNVIEVFLQMLGPRLTLRPGVRALEWLIRRFRIHIYNIRSLLLTVLPLHETPLFHNVLSLVPANRLVDEWKFLRPYHKAATNYPRHVIVYAASNNDGFLSIFNNYTLFACRNETSYPLLIRFWSGVVVEAVAARLGQAKSGRQEIQRQRTEDVLHKIMPVLAEGLAPTSPLEMIIASFALTVVLASSSMLDDSVVDSLMDAVSKASSKPQGEQEEAWSTLAILASQRSDPLITRRTLTLLSDSDDLHKLLTTICQKFSTLNLLLGAIRSTLKSLKKKDFEAKIGFLRRMFELGPSVASQSELFQWLVAVVSEIQRLDAKEAFENTVRTRLISLLQDLHEVTELSSAFAQLAALGENNNLNIEALLQISLAGPAALTASEDAMEVDDETQTQSTFDLAVAALPVRLPDSTKFLSSKIPPIYKALADVLRNCQKDTELLARFSTLPVWASTSVANPLYVAFLLRAAYSDHSLGTRVDATTLLTQYALSNAHSDLQNLLPYVSVLLGDQSSVIRKAACATILAIHQAASANSADSEKLAIFDHDEVVTISALSHKQILEVLQNVFIPHLEEFGSDSARIRYVLQHAMAGTVDQRLKSVSGDAMALKKGTRQALLEFFVAHAREAPFLRLKVGLIEILGDVSKAGSARKAETLLPILKQWAILSQTQAQSWVSTEGLSIRDVDSAMARLISAGERDSLTRVLEFVEGEKAKPRGDLVEAVFERIVNIWSSLPEDMQPPLALKLSQIALADGSTVAQSARAALLHVILSTEALQTLLEQAVNVTLESNDQPSPKRRRRSSSQGRAKPWSPAVIFRQSLPRLSLTLEIIDGVKPGSHPGTLPGLIDALLFLRRAKDTLQAESPYLLTLCLGSILAIVDKLKMARRPNVDWANIRADLVAECVRTSESPQVQTTALMLSASLASIAPEKVIHHIMPVFTMMGSKILAQEDQHSINVVNKAIDEIVPPLVASLRKQDASSLFESTKSLLSSFVAAFDHIPDQRKVPLFQRLLRQLGPNEFGFAIVALLVKDRPNEAMLYKFLDRVFAAFQPPVLLDTFGRLIALSRDVYAPQPCIAKTLIGASASMSANAKEEAALVLISTAQDMIKNKKLTSRVAKISKLNGPETESLEAQFKSCLLDTMEAMQDLRRHSESVQTALGESLVVLLELVSVKQFITILSTLLGELEGSETSLKPKAVRILASRLLQKGASDPATATVALEFLTNLDQMITSSEDKALKFAAVECIDRICTKYGRRDPDSIVSSATILAGEAGLGTGDVTIRSVAALALGTMLDILGEAAVPVVPPALDGAFNMIEQSFEADKDFKPDLHDPAFCLIESVVHSIPFMLSEESLDRVLILSARSAAHSRPAGAIAARTECLQEVSQKIDIDALTSSFSRVWNTVVTYGSQATLSAISTYSAAIGHHTKVDVTKTADEVSNFLLQTFDIRRTQLSEDTSTSFTSGEIDQIEAELNKVALAFIYKLSDASFRPLFTAWVDWATKARDLSTSGAGLGLAKLHRQTTLSSFLERFFSTLKSIVTSYAVYLIGPANEALVDFASSRTSDPANLALYAGLLAALRASFDHDADAFFAAPSHFEPLAKNLVAQLHLASQKSLRSVVFDRVIPTLVALASAVQDTPGHHLAINHYLAQLRHADSSHVRLASIRAHMAITDDEDVGDEWVNNVVSGTVSADGLLNGEKAGVGGAGETMIYVNEMLEDDEEEVEREVRKWVRIVRERVGEEVFET